MSSPRHHVYDPTIGDRADYHRARYEHRKAGGVCVRSGCGQPAVPDRILCEKHKRRSVEYARKVAARKREVRATP